MKKVDSIYGMGLKDFKDSKLTIKSLGSEQKNDFSKPQENPLDSLF